MERLSGGEAQEAPRQGKSGSVAAGPADLVGCAESGSGVLAPLQRPAEFAGRELLNLEEMANLQREAVDRNAELLTRPARRTEVTENLDVSENGAPGYYNNFWLGESTATTGRTSIIVDPPDGRLPPLTPEARQNEQARLAARSARGSGRT